MRTQARNVANCICMAAAAFCLQSAGAEKKVEESVPTAVLPFTEQGTDVKGMGGKVTALLTATLSADPSIWMVDRQNLDNILHEQDLNISGMVDTLQAIRIGALTGAKIMVVGSVFADGTDIHIVAKIIGTETSRMFGSSAKVGAQDSLDVIVKQLSADVSKTILAKTSLLIAQPLKSEELIGRIDKKIGDKKRPSIVIQILERHIGYPGSIIKIESTATLEMAGICKGTGFEVWDSEKKADIRIVGEAISEFAGRRGNLVSVKARVEVKAVDIKTDQVLATDQAVDVEVDLVDQIAGKRAIQMAVAKIAERLLPALAAAKR